MLLQAAESGSVGLEDDESGESSFTPVTFATVVNSLVF